MALILMVYVMTRPYPHGCIDQDLAHRWMIVIALKTSSEPANHASRLVPGNLPEITPPLAHSKARVQRLQDFPA